MTRAMLLEEEASKKDETGGEAGGISGGGSDSGSWTGTSQLVKTILET
jgi:hypothetical protein